MKKINLALALILLALLLAGCGGRRPTEISAAAVARDTAVKTYVANDNAADAFLIEKYKEAEQKRIDMAYKLKMAELQNALQKDLASMAGADGKLTFTPEQAASVIESIEKKKEAILLSRDMMFRQVDRVASALYAARERNKINLAVATKLNAAIEEYEMAGVDMSAAQKSIDAIFTLLQRHNIIDTESGNAPPGTPALQPSGGQ